MKLLIVLFGVFSLGAFADSSCTGVNKTCTGGGYSVDISDNELVISGKKSTSASYGNEPEINAKGCKEYTIVPASSGVKSATLEYCCEGGIFSSTLTMRSRFSEEEVEVSCN